MNLIDKVGSYFRQDQQVRVVDDPNDELSNQDEIIRNEATAAILFGLTLYAKGFAAAEVTPKVMRPWELAAVPLDIFRKGEWVAYLMIDGPGFYLARASSHDISGGINPRTWQYRLYLQGPSVASMPVRLMYDSVCHVRFNTHATAPWRGISPLSAMEYTMDLLGNTEVGLIDEVEIPRTQLVSHGPGVQDMSRVAQSVADGGVAMLEQSAQAWGTQRSGLANSVRVSRIGPEPSAAEVTLRAQVSQDVLSAMGIPAGLYSPREGSVSREAYRQWHASGLEPLGEILRAELEEKLQRPVTINFHKLAAADIAARARGLKALIDADVEPEDATVAVGMPGLRFVEPEPAPVMQMVNPDGSPAQPSTA